MASIDGVARIGASVRPAGEGTSTPSNRSGQSATRPFGQVLKDAIAQVNALQLEAQQMAEAVARGELTDMHRLVLTLERAQLALELTVAVRNKLLEAYQELCRMPV